MSHTRWETRPHAKEGANGQPWGQPSSGEGDWTSRQPARRPQPRAIADPQRPRRSTAPPVVRSRSATRIRGRPGTWRRGGRRPEARRPPTETERRPMWWRGFRSGRTNTCVSSGYRSLSGRAGGGRTAARSESEGDVSRGGLGQRAPPASGGTEGRDAAGWGGPQPQGHECEAALGGRGRPAPLRSCQGCAGPSDSSNSDAQRCSRRPRVH